jgi:hypothetical protein
MSKVWVEAGAQTADQHGEEISVIWQNTAPTRPSNPGGLKLVRLAPEKHTLQFDIALNPPEQVWHATVRGDYVVYTTWTGVARTRESVSYSVFARPLTAVSDPGASIALHRTQTARPITLPTQMPWALAPNMLASVASEQVHLRSYDGTVQVALGNDITALYYPSEGMISWLR